MPFLFFLFFGLLLAGGLTPLKISNEEVVLQGPLTPFSSRPSTPGKVTVSQIGFLFYFFPSYQMRWCKLYKKQIQSQRMLQNSLLPTSKEDFVFIFSMC
jgi:hypothetical protein